MKKVLSDNDNQPLELQPIAIALARVVKRLEDEQKIENSRDTDGQSADDNHKEAVDRRLVDLAAFERRASGGVHREPRRGRVP